ncbi:similar to Saccharomyces cerevisiae YOR085W OST3 Gamma subunit of the oligosaccharyltransferase complex of the ER lumen [Maudiozyma saulgeensis]|uniref:Similar to Saccharomyces cerevisiae YOR085W OST3 Gamma subunit of the oligosaccharyltransferase complex of the ER lumen n=1 Tax=Maudiozyma saulgeensis TaxID=1789683 RepID=A0A1X7R3Y5_9SACH|nr:similar to Saccharomyces cerevisiae YOR085W OST3 Gamma subunit of the oligosaccharyltransferase complex of the ER lumen [Kazachstania saulgeensis]
MLFDRFVSVCISALLLATTALAATREELAIKAQKSPNGIIELDDYSFKDTLDAPRDFYLVALLTCTEPGVGCTACFEFNPVFETIAESWVRDHAEGISLEDPSKALYFARADLSDASAVPEIFKFYNIERVPRLMFFTPGGSIHDYHLLNLPQQKANAGASEFITNLKIAVGINDYQIHEPRDWSTVMITAIATFAIVYLFRKHNKVITAVISSKFVWGILCCAFITLMSGGYMYNKMRGTPLAGSDNNGGVVYFWPNEFQNQYGIESQIVSVLYGALSILFLALVLGIPNLSSFYKGSASGAMIITVICTVLVVVIYALFAGLTSLFSIKSPRYPFELIKISSLLS